MKSWLAKLFGSAHRTPLERSPRVTLLQGEEVYFEAAGERYGIRNLSETGVGLEKADAQLEKGAVLEGRLWLLGREIAVRLEVMYANGPLIGAKFLGDTRPVRSALVHLFREEVQAKKMSEVAPERLAREGEGSPRWFYAPGNYELYFLERDGEILRIELNLNGRVLTRERGGVLRMGLISEEGRTKPSHARASLVEWQAAPDEGERAKAERVLRNIPSLPPELRDKLAAFLKNSD